MLGILLISALNCQMGEQITVKLQPKSPYLQDVVYFALERYVDEEPSARKQHDKTATTPTWTINCEKIQPEQRAWFRELAQLPSAIYVVAAVKKHLASSEFLHSRALLHSEFSMPATLREFEQQTQFQNWKQRVIPRSEVKGLTRVLYESPPDTPTMRIAQTLQSETGELDAAVRETEIILERSGKAWSGRWDFYAYDSQGKLSNRSLFATKTKKQVEGPVPFTCLACHYSSEERLFSPQVMP